eukprot:m.112724 g.112724  ORF g.112724 m.112724 type:complete len:210 (+) comp28214_c0_seq5:327-956(+)
MSKTPTVIGITGCTRSGKSVVGKRVAQRLSTAQLNVPVICQDSFYKRKVTITLQSGLNVGKTVKSSEEPECTDYDTFTQHISESITETADCHNLIDSKFSPLKSFVIVEGHQLLWDERVRNLLTFPVFLLEITKEEGCRRRTAPQTQLNPKPQSFDHFNTVTWPSFEKYLINVIDPLGDRVYRINSSQLHKNDVEIDKVVTEIVAQVTK